MKTDKHAYLIMAHGSEKILRILLELIDDERNDIFLHIDKKCNSIDVNKLLEITNKSKIYLIPSMDCRWGEFSLVECELRLIKKALSIGICYNYLHLLSGVDLPLKTQDEIHTFFESNQGNEFINIEEFDSPKIRNQISWYWKDKSNNSFFNKTKCRLHNIYIDRFNKPRNSKINLIKTSQWFSITYDCAEFIYKKRRFIKRHFNNTDCPDEMFMGSVIYGTCFWNHLNNCFEYANGNMNNMRLIDWERGQNNSPYTFTFADKDILENSQMLFARKFGEQDIEIAEYLKRKLLAEKRG